MITEESKRVKLGVRIMTWRHAAGLTGSQLADRMRERGFKWDAPQVSRIENGRRAISAFALSALADALNTTSATLLGEDDE